MKLFGWTAVVIMLMASSCSDEQIKDHTDQPPQPPYVAPLLKPNPFPTY